MAGPPPNGVPTETVEAISRERVVLFAITGALVALISHPDTSGTISLFGFEFDHARAMLFASLACSYTLARWALNVIARWSSLQRDDISEIREAILRTARGTEALPMRISDLAQAISEHRQSADRWADSLERERVRWQETIDGVMGGIANIRQQAIETAERRGTHSFEASELVRGFESSLRGLEVQQEQASESIARVQAPPALPQPTNIDVEIRQFLASLQTLQRRVRTWSISIRTRALVLDVIVPAAVCGSAIILTFIGHGAEIVGAACDTVRAIIG